MKKIDKSISKNYLPLKLYLEDLENIEVILKEASKSLSIETEEYKFDSIADIKSNLKRDRIKELHLKTSDPYITLDFTPLWARVYVSSSETNGAGIFYKLNQIIESRTRFLKWLYSFHFLWATGGVFWLSSFILPKWTFTSSPLYFSLY
jgi:hypothetical protein